MPERAFSLAPTQEMALLDHIERLDKLRAGRTALHIRFSCLSPYNRRPDYIRIATETFENAIRLLDGQLFILSNADILYIARNVPVSTLDGAVNKLRVLFSEDPVLQYIDTHTQQFCSWYHLDKDYENLLDIAKNLLKEAEINRELGVSNNALAEVSAYSPIRPELLARLEQTLSKADVSNVVRRQMACTIIDNVPLQPLFEEIYVSIDDLQQITTPDVDLMANRWLFQYLTQTLDKRVMAMMIRDGIRSDRPFSLNLNVASVLTPDFARFEQAITPQLRGRLVIEFNKLDVFSDMGAFIFARDYLRDHGFRLCLDGLTHHTLPYYDRTRLGFDLIKIYWTPDSIDNMLPEMIPEIRHIVMDAGQARTILCRCETERSVEIGQQLGIVMFQGRHVDKLYAAHRLATGAAVTLPIRQ